MLMHILYFMLHFDVFSCAAGKVFYIGLKFYNTESTSRYDKHAQDESSHT
jgi:hypothetical protein